MSERETPASEVQESAGTSESRAGWATLRRNTMSIPSDIAPEETNMPIAVSSRGHVAYFRSRRTPDFYVTIVDSLGRLKSQVGRPGQGPGELSGSVELLFRDTLLVVFDRDQARVSIFSPNGKLLDDHPSRFGLRPLAVTAESLDYLARSTGAAEVVRLPLAGGKGRTLVAGADSFLPEATSGNRLAGMDVPPYASDGRRLAIGDPRTYRIRYYDALGHVAGGIDRTVPARRRTAQELELASEDIRRLMRSGMRGPQGPVRLQGLQARLDSLPDEALPHFSRHGMAFDGLGRLWVIGSADDSAFADTFAGTKFIGRQMLPCAGHFASVSLNGAWLALLCRVETTGDDDDAELQVYRIEEGVSP